MKERESLAKVKSDGYGRVVVVCNCGHAINLGPLADDPAVGRDLLGSILPDGIDSDTLLIAALLFMLLKEGGDIRLVIALGYILL